MLFPWKDCPLKLHRNVCNLRIRVIFNVSCLILLRLGLRHTFCKESDPVSLGVDIKTLLNVKTKAVNISLNICGKNVLQYNFRKSKR